MENDTEMAAPSGESSGAAAPEAAAKTSSPPTTIADGAPAPTTDLATEPVSQPSPDPLDPPAGDAATAGPPNAPLALGTAAPIGDRYMVSMIAVDLDATEVVVGEDPTNQPPPPGEVYVMTTLDVRFTGLTGEVEPYFDLLIGAVDVDGREYDDIDCVALTPGDMYGAPLIGPGEALVGTFCLVVPKNATDGLTFFVEENQSSADTRVWWSLGG